MITEDELYERIFDLKQKNDVLNDENEKLKQEIEYLNEKIEEIENDRNENYKPIPKNEQYDIYDNMFI